MYGPDFYGFFKTAFTFAQSLPETASDLYLKLAFVASTVVAIGLGAALIMLILIVYVSIRLEAMEHHGFHLKEMAEHAHHEPEFIPEKQKNPRWDAILLLAHSDNESDWRRAILDADIMLAQMLSEKGYPGETLGEQLKMGNPLQFTTIDIAWEAHRMRNALAHLGEAFPLSERDAHTTIEQYRRVFEEFDYI
ncbi:hypothetical protein K2Q08_03485 [Patescibacteria group bacterium]|nr:hypothetical protein [Patescibacteria group bacterium]